jgi:hypothetical protein
MPHLEPTDARALQLQLAALAHLRVRQVDVVGMRRWQLCVGLPLEKSVEKVVVLQVLARSTRCVRLREDMVALLTLD